jgi:hypothetical protein
MNAFETAYAAAETEVEAGIIHFGSLCSLIRDRIMRIDEATRPIPTLAPIYRHDALLAERASLIERLREVKARWGQ